MKNIFSKVYILIALLFISISSTYSYDQSFSSIKLRHGYEYNFYDIFDAGSYKLWINDVFTTFSENVWDLNWGTNPSFVWADEIKNKNFIINPNTSVKTIDSDKKYQVFYKPTARKINALEIIYDTKYYREVSWKWQWPIRHTEYQPYEITWCGDGVRDNYTDYYSSKLIKEECDPNDPNKVGFGKNGCDKKTCEAF